METFKTLLKQKGLKATGQRAIMLKAIEEHGHIDLDNLRDKMREVSPNISLNTIYLNLEQLSNEGVISKVALNNQKSVYEITKHTHAHLVCKVCGSVEDEHIESGVLSAVKESAKGSSFEPSFVAVNIYGVCKQCVGNQTTKESR
ncbi:MAG TPA: Fur family transcriptional regulator [Campylobacterales bacterium]|nr:Fur family transcriptional regulator [Campylobacterales bacterium]